MSSEMIALAVIDGEPRVDSRIIARELGVDHHNTSALVDKYSAHFQEFGILLFKTEEINGRGQPEKFCLLTEDQTYFLMTLVRNTVQAVGLKKRLVQAFAECRNAAFILASPISPRFRPDKTRKALPGGLTLEQQDAVKALVKSRVEALPHDDQARGAITCWSAIKSKFGVTYKEVPSASFAEVLSLVARLELDKAAPKALPLDIHYPLESAAPPAGERGLSFYAFAQDEDWVDPCLELLLKLKALGYNVDGPIYSHQAKIHIMTAMYNGLVGKAVDSMNVACTVLPYAPIYLR